jgi:uncharacterized protein YhdP
LRFGKYLRAHHFTRAGLIAAGVAVMLVFFVLGAAIRLLIGPVSLGPFSGTLSEALSQAMPGLSVKYDQAAVEWSREEGRVGLVILGARVFDSDGRIIAQAPKAAIDLSARSVFSGHPQVKRITLIGVQLTLVRTAQGGLRLGVGNDVGERDFLTNITDAITATNNKTSSLQAFAVHDARVAFLDQVTGLFVVAPSAQMTITTAGPRIAASLSADIEVSGHPAHIAADLLVPPAKGAVTGDLDVKGLDLGALGANAKMFAPLKGIALNVDLSTSFTIDHGAHLAAADFGLGAHGIVGLPGLIAGPVHVRSVSLVGRYDAQSGRLLIDEGSLKSDQASLHLIGGANLKYDANQAISAVDFDTTADRIAINAPGTMAKPIGFRRLALRGSYLPATREIILDHFGLEGGGPFAADASGKVSLAANGQSAALDLKGTIAPLSVRDMLDYWPMTVGSGAREWLDKNFLQGHIGPIAIEAHVPAGAFDQHALPDGALAVQIPISGGELNYLNGLTHLTQLNATTVLRGNSYEANVQSAKIGTLTLTNGHVVIPDLSAPGSPADVSAHIDGAMPDLLAVLDMKPLNYPTRFGVSASDTQGNASIDMSVHLPLIRELTVDQVAIGVKSHVTGFDIALGKSRLTNGVVDFDVNNDRMIVQGNAMVADSTLALTWNENFKSSGPASTEIHAKGTLDDAAREALYLHTADYLKGPVGVDATITGKHGHFANANIALDLTPSTVAVDLIGIEKPQGTAATGQIGVVFGPASAVKSETIRMTAPAGTLAAQLSYAKDGSLQSLSLPGVKYGPSNDFSLNYTKSATSTDVVLRGHSLDGSALAHAGSSGSSSDSTQFDGPYHISARLDRLALREGVQLSQVYLDATGDGPRINTMSLSGSFPHGSMITGNVAGLNGARHLNFTTDDAGQLARGLFGLSGMKGGKLDVAAVFPQSGPPDAPSTAPDFEGKISLKDATITNQPLVARLLSLASFAGLFQGSGLEIDHLDVPFSSKNGVISVHDAVASGPTIGVTADGYIDRPQNVVAMKGSLVPVVGIDFNKVLGAIPLVGNILVSKKGEGMFGVTYSMSGSADQPSVSVNPLAMLTPGILRRLFQGRIPNASQAPSNNVPPPAASASAGPPPASPTAPPPAKPQ